MVCKHWHRLARRCWLPHTNGRLAPNEAKLQQTPDNQLIFPRAPSPVAPNTCNLGPKLPASTKWQEHNTLLDWRQSHRHRKEDCSRDGPQILAIFWSLEYLGATLSNNWSLVCQLQLNRAVYLESGLILVWVAITQLHRLTKTLPFLLCIAVREQSAEKQRSQFRSRSSPCCTILVQVSGCTRSPSTKQITRWVKRLHQAAETNDLGPPNHQQVNFNNVLLILQFKSLVDVWNIYRKQLFSTFLALCVMFPPAIIHYLLQIIVCIVVAFGFIMLVTRATEPHCFQRDRSLPTICRLQGRGNKQRGFRVHHQTHLSNG